MPLPVSCLITRRLPFLCMWSWILIIPLSDTSKSSSVTLLLPRELAFQFHFLCISYYQDTTWFIFSLFFFFSCVCVCKEALLPWYRKAGIALFFVEYTLGDNIKQKLARHFKTEVHFMLACRGRPLSIVCHLLAPLQITAPRERRQTSDLSVELRCLG